MIYRMADKNDIDELVRMRIAYINEDYEEISEEQILQIQKALPNYFENHTGVDFFAFVAEDSGKMVSCAMLVVTEKPANPSFITGKTGTVLNVYTEKSYRRKGIATIILNNLIEYSKALGLDFIELKATKEGYPLYKKLGFEEQYSTYTPMKFNLTNQT
ncbi:MAG: GNAT family N-acetyltransferase [Ruminococcus sp.]|nr:GNAT family N-acetyltransferase [Ruminococcus sp.]